MGISHSTARWLAPLSFAVDFAAQQYGLLSSPNMKDIHDANISFWSPNPYFIGGFFFPQQLLQIAWLYRLYKLDPKKKPAEKAELDTIVDFVPYYAVGNFCIATWMIFWNSSALKTSNAFVTINTLTQLYYIFARQPRMNTNSRSSVLTHMVSKTFAGIGVLDLLHNGSIAYFDHQRPDNMVKVLTAITFGALAVTPKSDWIFGGCLVYDLIALAVGQSGVGDKDWGKLLGVYALGTAGIVAAKNLIRPPYDKHDTTLYEAVSTEDL